jgi:parvulin-like peptidyl-prolyl isomerase
VSRSLEIPPVRVQNALPQITKKVWASQVRYNFLVSARTQQDDMHHRSILTTTMKKQEEEEEEEEGALLRVSTSPSSTELPRINHN